MTKKQILDLLNFHIHRLNSDLDDCGRLSVIMIEDIIYEIENLGEDRT